MNALQWGGRFASGPDRQLLAFGSSLADDLVLAPFDLACSLAHVRALAGGAIVSASDAAQLEEALHRVRAEIDDGSFARYARDSDAEDVHGAIDARVRDLAGSAGEYLHAGRSRNDQVATTLLLYVRARANDAAGRAAAMARCLVARARAELDAGTLVAGCTHWQPAQPASLAFVLTAWSQPFLRAAQRFQAAGASASESCPLGSGAISGSTLPLDRAGAAELLGFRAPSRNALDAIGNRDAALDLAHACVRAAVDASRVAAELVAWCAPAYGYVRLDDAVATGSSLMPQKRNPDTFELVRARAAKLVGLYAGALGTLCGLATSYHRDLQETKALAIAVTEHTLALLEAFHRAWHGVTFVRERMTASAGQGFTIATDVADAAIAGGATARAAHAAVGRAVTRAETQARDLQAADVARIADELGLAALDAPLDAGAAVGAKRTDGSTAPDAVASQLAQTERELATFDCAACP